MVAQDGYRRRRNVSLNGVGAELTDAPLGCESESALPPLSRSFAADTRTCVSVLNNIGHVINVMSN